MDAYWLIEYGKVFSAYIFWMFIWPWTVFRRYLKNKNKIFCFSFCVIVQIVMSNAIVLMMGLFHILNLKVVALLLYIVFFYSVLKSKLVNILFYQLIKKSEPTIHPLESYRENAEENIRNMLRLFHSRIGEYILLFLIVIFGMLYFSYGPLHEYSYGHFDMRLHHEWINGLLKGDIFSNGIYPEAMHCFIYCIHALFGIRIHSIILFLQGIHVMVFILSAYSLMREIFSWRYTPFFVITLFLTMDFVYPYCMVRLQSTLPLEFGLHLQFLCALYLVRYLEKAKSIIRKGKNTRFYWDENLLLFMLALAAAISTHFYIPIMAFVLCFCFAIFNIKKLLKTKYMIPLVVSVLCGCIIAATPMAGAAVSGNSFEGSIYWGLNNIKKENQNVQQSEIETDKIVRGPLDLTSEDLNIIDKLPGIGKKVIEKIIKAELFGKAIYHRGYQGMYWQKRGRRIFVVTLGVITFCLFARKKTHKQMREIIRKYYPIILVSILDMIIFMAYEAPDLGLRVIIADHRICTTEHMMVLMVMMMPADFIFSWAAHFYRDRILQLLSGFSVAGIYLYVNISGNFHGYLYYAWAQYNSAIMVSNSINDEFPKDSFTVVSQWEDSCDIEFNGEFEHIADFVKKCDHEYYSLPTKYIFLYIEKRPIVEYQQYYFSGPSWLAKSGNSEKEVFEISKEAAQETLPKTIEDVDTYRIILESKAYEWCQSFVAQYPSEMQVYYEDEDFVCYCFEQDINNPYNLSTFKY